MLSCIISVWSIVSIYDVTFIREKNPRVGTLKALHVTDSFLASPRAEIFFKLRRLENKKQLQIYKAAKRSHFFILYYDW